ncbi:hypothetical protein [Leptospirillum ferrooxidans]|uniref:Uncharacterized protein n=1 Tax=Leptospirillum ferrooxidans (strain C2-3) TaxID=1162668 RepID=I0ILV1_LEPFC|nr:hypothetical protein [Leptospirillum ferrooxidans]BAM06250.1 hypothetical protein LFE_0534 [Leptospirillum ferrooxidans C2-3]
MPLPGKNDLEKAINEFMEINSSLDMPRARRKFEGHVLAQVIAGKIDALSSVERQSCIVFLLGYLAGATNIAYRKGAEVETMMLPSDN